MNPIQVFLNSLNQQQQHLLSRLNHPLKIQEFLDTLPYTGDEAYHCPRVVLQKREAHCFDGALFAAAALRLLGHPPLIVYLIAENDDDHLLAPFKTANHWGAIGKSNYTGLRFREPIHRSLRELVMTYFDPYFNVKRQKTLRSYTVPLNLTAFDRYNWMETNETLELISERLDEIRIVPLLTRRMIRSLSPVDKRSYQAGLLGSKKAGLFDPM